MHLATLSESKCIEEIQCYERNVNATTMDKKLYARTVTDMSIEHDCGAYIKRTTANRFAFKSATVIVNRYTEF